MLCKILFALLFGASYIYAQNQTCTLPQWTGCQQLIIDTDGGVDDGIAISRLLFAFKMGYGPRIRAITLTYGISSVKQAAINIGKILEVAGLPDIPFYIGASEPLVPPTIEAEPIYGADAFGDIGFNRTIPPPTPGDASRMIVSMVNELGDNAILLALGPLTNIAMAYKINKNLFNKLQRLDIAAGSVRGAGDILPGREFNIYQDPYAFKVVLANTHYTQATLYPLDLVSDAAIPESFWASLPTTTENNVNFFHDIVRFYTIDHPTTVMLPPVVAIAAVIYPQIVRDKQPLRVDCVLSNEGRGVLLVDYANKDINPETSNFLVILDVDIEEYKRVTVLLASL